MANKPRIPDFVVLSLSSRCSLSSLGRTPLPWFPCSSATFSFGRAFVRLPFKLLLPSFHFCADLFRIELSFKLRKQLGFLLFDMVLHAFGQDRIFRIIPVITGAHLF